MSDKQIVEINGVKLEVDLRYARRIEELRVGSRVKVLIKGYSEHAVHPGIIVGFEPFQKLPTIVIAYVVETYGGVELKVVHWNAETKDVEVVASMDDDRLIVSKTTVMNYFDRERAKLQRQLEELDMKQSYFMEKFGQYYEAETADS